MKSFWAFPWDEARFNGDFTRYMLMAVVIHTYKDWSVWGGVGIIALAFAYSLYQHFVRYKIARDLGGA